MRPPPALRNRVFRTWLGSLFIAGVGTWMQRVAQDWLVLELTGRSGAALGLVTGLQFLPILLLGPVAGVLADRYQKRLLLIASQLVVGLCGLALGLTVLAGAAQLWHVYAVAVVLGMANAVFQPTVQAFVAELVDREQVPSAIGLSGGSIHVARLIGPAAAGLLIVVGGTGPVFLVTTATAVPVVIALLRLRPAVTPSESRGGRAMFVNGIKYALGHREIRLILGIMVFIGTFAANTQVTSALIATTVFGKGAGEYGILGSLAAVGSVLGAVLAARRVSVSRRFVIRAAVAFSCCVIVSGLMPTFGSFAAVLALVGVTQLTFITAANSFMQLEVEPEMRGRMMALFMMLLTGSTPIGAPVLGLLADRFGARSALIIFGAVALLGTLFVTGLLGRRPTTRAADVPEPSVPGGQRG
ncbi:MFS transporter [Nonomuraea sp. CA-141351]|uniref:MFS transporter n=1 Tax=Nonomuraea sp. CA-141351 TaxID=3239996 RepID=UPI003D8CFCFD